MVLYKQLQTKNKFAKESGPMNGMLQADFKAAIPRKPMRFMGANAKYAYVALKNALEHAGLEKEDGH
eukprot:3608598-Amphidinium_carterae.1